MYLNILLLLIVEYYSGYGCTYWGTFCLFPVFYSYRWSSYEQLCICFCVDICFHFSVISAQECNCWVIWQICTEGFFFRNSQTVFRRGSTVLHSYQQCMSVSFSPHPHQHVLLFSYSVRYIVISFCASNLHFSNG